MNKKKKDYEETPIHLSPLKLIYSAYTDERPVFTPAMEEGFGKLEDSLSSLPQTERNAVFRTVYEIYAENERRAFLAGIRTGVRLMEELAKRERNP